MDEQQTVTKGLMALEAVLELIQNGQHQQAAATIMNTLTIFDNRVRSMEAQVADQGRRLREAEAGYEAATRRQVDELRTAMTRVERLKGELMQAIKAVDEVS